MKIMRLISLLSVATFLAPALIGTASADSLLVTASGPNSEQSTLASNQLSVDAVNQNNAVIGNTNTQSASTGSAFARSNTSVGGQGSGMAANANATQSSVLNTNIASTAPTVGGQGSSVVAVGGYGSVTSPSASVPAKSSGSVLGASIVAGMGSGSPAILPVTGPTVPVDVSAIRAAWHPQIGISSSSLARHTSAFTAGMLITATLLSLLGAAGSALYTRRQERRV
jgi:hypothetical protein